MKAEEILEILTDHIYPVAGPDDMIICGKQNAAHAIAEKIAEDVVWERRGVVDVRKGYHEDERDAYDYLAHYLVFDGNEIYLGSDYDEGLMKTGIYLDEELTVQVRREK